jgi:hypothetical protein
MAKIDLQMAAFEQGFTNPEVKCGTMWVPDEQMEQLKVRRRKAGQSQHRLWYLSVGETGQSPTATFYGHKLSDCITQALAWRGLPTKNRRGPNAQASA